MIITKFLSLALVVFAQAIQPSHAETVSEKVVDQRSPVIQLANALAAVPRSKRDCNSNGCGDNGYSNNRGCSNGNCNRNGENGGRHASATPQAPQLGLRELLALLPFLSQARIAGPPLASPPVALPPVPTFQMPFVAAAASPGGNMVNLGRPLTQRQAEQRKKRGCNGCGGGGGGGCNGGCSNGNSNHHKSGAETAGLSLRELLMILPFLSQGRLALPVAPLSTPGLPSPLAAAAPAPGADIVQLARTLARRQVKNSISKAMRAKRNCNGGGCGGNGNGNGGCNGGNGGNGGCNGSNNGGGGGCSNGQCNNRNNYRSSSRSDPPGLSIRELLMLLPFLSQPTNPAPLLAAPPPAVPGAIPLLPRITRRQVPYEVNEHMKSTPELRAQLRRMMMEEAKRMASIVVTPHPTFGPKLAVPTTTIPEPTTTWPSTTPVPPSQIVDDYDLVPEPVIDPRKGKVSPGDACNWDSDCVPGAQCQRSAVAGLFKYCVCRLPLMGFDGLCVLPRSFAAHRGH